MVKILEPKISSLVDYSLEDAYRDNCYNNMIFTQSVLKDIKIVNETIDSCIFRGIDFSNIDFSNVDFIDVIFEECDLSNKKFDGNLLQRVKFINCKMIGVSYIDSSVKDVCFDLCSARYINFAGARIIRMVVSESDFSEGCFQEVSVKDLEFNSVNLSRVEIFKTKLCGVDISSCQIEKMVVDLESLEGIIIDRFQAVYLVGMLGVKIKE